MGGGKPYFQFFFNNFFFNKTIFIWSSLTFKHDGNFFCEIKFCCRYIATEHRAHLEANLPKFGQLHSLLLIVIYCHFFYVICIFSPSFALICHIFALICHFSPSFCFILSFFAIFNRGPAQGRLSVCVGKWQGTLEDHQQGFPASF